MRRCSDHREGKSQDLHHVAERGRHHPVPADGRGCEYLKRGVHVKRMDVELDMEMETDCVVYTIPKRLYKSLYDENGSVKDYTMEMISEKFSDIMWLFNQFVFSNVASRLAGALLEHRAMEGSDILPVTHEVLARDAGTAREVVTRLLKQFQEDGMVRLTRGKVEILDTGRLGKV